MRGSPEDPTHGSTFLAGFGVLNPSFAGCVDSGDRNERGVGIRLGRSVLRMLDCSGWRHVVRTERLRPQSSPESPNQVMPPFEKVLFTHDCPFSAVLSRQRPVPGAAVFLVGSRVSARFRSLQLQRQSNPIFATFRALGFEVCRELLESWNINYHRKSQNYLLQRINPIALRLINLT